MILEVFSQYHFPNLLWLKSPQKTLRFTKSASRAFPLVTFENKTAKDGVTYYKVTIQRTYKDGFIVQDNEHVQSRRLTISC